MQMLINGKLPARGHKLRYKGITISETSGGGNYFSLTKPGKESSCPIR